MDKVLTVMEIVALLCVSALSVFLIIALTKLNSFLANIERDIHDIAQRAMPVFSNLEVITSRFRTISESIEDELEAVRRSIGAVRGIADSIVDFERRVQRRIEEPIMETASTIAGFYKGLKTFFGMLGVK